MDITPEDGEQEGVVVTNIMRKSSQPQLSQKALEEVVNNLVDTRFSAMENVISSNALSVSNVERQVQEFMEFFPLDKMKLDVSNGEEYVARVAKTACRGIFDDTRENVGSETDTKILEIQKTLTEKWREIG